MAQSAQTAAATSNPDGPSTNPNKDKKASDPLFGPNIGPCSAGPAWTTTASRKKLITDDLTPDVLTGWVEKSKQPSQPTTTLQALVNLKRPTLRLSPLSSVPEDSQSPVEVHHQHLHGLEFEYDCDAPKCGIYVHVVLSKSHPEAVAIPSASNQAQILVFESVASGGFGKRLTLEEGALLELGRYDLTPEAATAPDPPEDIPKSESTTDVASASNGSDPSTAHRSNRRHRFTHFHFRKRSVNRSVAGPALAVVDADPQSNQEAKKDKDKEEKDGVRVIIRLAALDEQGTELASPNEQTTFLHIVRLSKSNEPAANEDGAGETDDNRPWVVKVVKREATIGPHTFQLHEIYGLTSSANAQAASSTSNPDSVHTYPPQANGVDDDDPSSECLLCLSSPREVILIPCRHLVACKECALNMVEFGAGGQITHATEPAVPAPVAVAADNGTGDGANGTTSGSAGTTGDGSNIGTGAMSVGSPSAPALPPVTTTTRRKRKAKGWFCPVCRQPYTSLLRISTAAPPPLEKEERNSLEDHHHHHHHHGGVAGGAGGATGTGGTSGSGSGDNQQQNDETTERVGGLLGGAFSRPGFLRGFSGLTRGSASNVNGGGAGGGEQVTNDVESRAGLGRAGA